MTNCHSAPNKTSGTFSGILYGLIPHSFCILFIIFSTLGASSASILLGKFLRLPNLFTILIIASLFFATLSAIFYLKKTDCLCLQKINSKWKYLFTLYGTTLVVNLLIIFVFFPFLTNVKGKELNPIASASMTSYIDIQVPCSGHAPLIIDELGKDPGIYSVSFQNPRTFKINYDPQMTSLQKIISQPLFEDFKPSKIY